MTMMTIVIQVITKKTSQGKIGVGCNLTRVVSVY